MNEILIKKITLMAFSSTNENILDSAKLDPKHYKIEFENELR